MASCVSLPEGLTRIGEGAFYQCYALQWAALPESLTERYERTLGFYSCTVPLFEQYVLAELLRSRIETLADIPEKSGFFHKLPEFGIEMFNNKKSKCSPEVAKAVLEELVPRFRALPEPGPETVTPLIEEYAAKHEVKLGQPMWAVRIALSGLPATPGGPGEIMAVLGKEESLRRLDAALARLA